MNPAVRAMVVTQLACGYSWWGAWSGAEDGGIWLRAGKPRAGYSGADKASVVPPGVWVDDSDEDDPVLRNADGSMVDTWREDYPYAERMSS